MSAFLDDTFADTDSTAHTSHTGETGATWTDYVNTSAWAIQSNRLRRASGGYSLTITNASGTPASAEYDVIYTFRRIGAFGGSDDGYDGVAFRVNTATAELYTLMYESHSGSRRLHLYKGQFGTSLGTYSWTPTADTDYEIKVECRDAAKKVFLDGVEVISSGNNDFAAAGVVGIAGTGVYQAGGSSNIDRIRAGTDLGGGGGGANRRRRALICGSR